VEELRRLFQWVRGQTDDDGFGRMTAEEVKRRDQFLDKF
jgi:hypothetical protein